MRINRGGEGRSNYHWGSRHGRKILIELLSYGKVGEDLGEFGYCIILSLFHFNQTQESPVRSINTPYSYSVSIYLF